MSKTANDSTANDDGVEAGEVLNNMAIRLALHGYDTPAEVLVKGFYDGLFVIVTDHSVHPSKIDSVVSGNVPNAKKGTDGWKFKGKEVVVASQGSRVGTLAYAKLKAKTKPAPIA